MKSYSQGTSPDEGQGGILLFYALPGAGKTTIAILETEKVAEPLFFANFDRSASHLLARYKGTKYYYDRFHAGNKEEALDCLERLGLMRQAALQAGHGVFSVDNGLAFWDIVKLAFLPKQSSGEPLPKEFADANSYIRDFLLGLEESGLWIIITAPASQVWVGAKTAMDMYSPDGWKHQDYHYLAAVELFCRTAPGPALEELNRYGLWRPLGGRLAPVQSDEAMFQFTYHGQITSAKRRPVAQGQIMDNPTLLKVLMVLKELKVPSVPAPDGG